MVKRQNYKLLQWSRNSDLWADGNVLTEEINFSIGLILEKR